MPRLGRYSYLAADPFGWLTVENGIAFWNGQPCPEPPLAALRARLAAHALPKDERLLPLQTGVIGYFAYDFAPCLDPAAKVVRSQGVQASLGFYDVVLAFDHETGKGWLMASGLPETEPEARHRRAEQRLAQFKSLLERPLENPMQGASHRDSPVPTSLAWRQHWRKADYLSAVRRVKEHILAGDLYQANIAQCFEADVPRGFDSWRFYKDLRSRNPAPYAAFLAQEGRHTGDAIASSSPEAFLSLIDGMVETRPIKGTQKRLEEPELDAACRDNLARSEKDRAENIMIVDLLRNDLSKVCTAASIEVPDLCVVETYAGVHHLVSSVTGRLRPGCDALDLFAACFPGGSITGAPKLKAMEIIAAIENRARGPYCGAIGFIAFNGDMALNIAIRTIVFAGDKACLNAGGGITLLSDPEAEYAESLAKLERIFEREGSA